MTVLIEKGCNIHAKTEAVVGENMLNVVTTYRVCRLAMEHWDLRVRKAI